MYNVHMLCSVVHSVHQTKYSM